MTYRKSNKSPELQWLKKNRQFLLEIGIPDSIVDNEKRWNYLLLHGDDEFGNGWKADSLGPDVASRLINALNEIYTNQIGLDLFDVLKKVEKVN